MTKARDISSLIGSSGQIDNTKITLDANEIPALDTAKVTTGTFSADRINNASLSNVTQLPFSAGTDWQSTIVTGSTLTAVAGKGYWIDTTSNACTVTLPASASVGDFIEFADYARTWGTNKITINQNSLNFQGYSSPNPEYNTSGQSVKIIYSGATQGWIPSVDDDVTDEVPQTYTVDFLVIGGGGSGGRYVGGGGGAGGYRNSYSTETSGGGGSSETSLALTPNTVYTITVGAGGSIPSAGTRGNDGNDSSISGSGITTITSTGGGAGGGEVGSPTAGGAGGSGGGGGGNSGQSGGSGTADQGYDGGTGSSITTSASGGGGGGGAASAGTNGSTNGGNGGTYLASSITGSSVDRAGGGGASGKDAGTRGVGGGGGAGNGASAGNVAGSGTANTGSGGGGAHDGNSGAGGSGIVILRMATADYSGTYSGSPSVSTSGSDTILVFNASGSYTA